MEWFADAWFHIALIDRRDAHHQRAKRILARIPDVQQLVTHDAVLTEVLAHFSDDGAASRRAAADTVRQMLRYSRVVECDRALFQRALDRYASRPDKEWSHVDCTSMIVMEDRGIRHVLTNDHHFTQAGFTVVSE